MSKVYDFLKEGKVFYLATTEGNKPHVRPFGAVAEVENKVYYFTTNDKAVFKQIKENPLVEIATTTENGDWVRIAGSAVIDSRKEAREAFLNTSCKLKKKYSADDGITEVFYLENATATYYISGQEPLIETI